MKKSLKKNEFTRESIIGLGEESFRKNYYPELQSKIIELEKTNARNKAIINTIPDVLLVSDISENISPFTVIGEYKKWLTMQFLRNSELIEELRVYVKSVLEDRQMRTYNFRQEIDQEMKFMEARVNISDINEVLIIIRDITEQSLLEMKLRDMADRDGMTGLYNRRIFEEKMVELNDEDDKTICIIIVDIDGLKIWNDTLGHQTGDDVIRSVADIILKVFNGEGLIARISGDEFGIIICNNDKAIEEKIESLLDNVIMSIDLYNEKNDMRNISVSYGYAIKYSGILHSKELFKEADNKMYQNKMFKSSSIRNGIVKTLMKALEAKDYITEGHADRMGFMAKRMAKNIGLSQNSIDKVMLLAKFHDIGKVGIPDRILNKPDKLNQEEYKIMKTHTLIGKRIAIESQDLSEIANLIYSHHERWDGNGYPTGLSKKEIPIECRILSIVDTYDAMTNDRPYRKALTQKETMDEIIRNKGSQFDPELVECFLELDLVES